MEVTCFRLFRSMRLMVTFGQVLSFDMEYIPRVTHLGSLWMEMSGDADEEHETRTDHFFLQSGISFGIGLCLLLRGVFLELCLGLETQRAKLGL
jgi:hypothetical protein